MLCAAVVIFVTQTRCVQGWGGRTHRWVAFQALRRCGAELGLTGDGEATEDSGAAWRLVARGAQAADGHGPGAIPTIGHILHPAGEGRPEHGKAPDVIEVLTDRIAERGRDPRGRLFDLGRLCHIAADLCQPQHTAGRETNPDEDRQHHHFERMADRMIDGLAPGAGDPATSDLDHFAGMATLTGLERKDDDDPLGPREAGLVIALTSHRDYSRMTAAYREKREDILRVVARRQVLASIDATVALWREARRRQREEERSWGALELAPWLLLWVGVMLLPRKDEDEEDPRSDEDIYREMWSDWK